MQTKMSVLIIIKGKINSKELYEDLKPYGLNVTDTGEKTMVYATIDIREPTIEYILETCNKYGDYEVHAQRLKDSN